MRVPKINDQSRVDGGIRARPGRGTVVAPPGCGRIQELNFAEVRARVSVTHSLRGSYGERERDSD